MRKPNKASKNWNGVGPNAPVKQEVLPPNYYCRKCERYGHPEDSHLDRFQFDRGRKSFNVNTE